MAMIIEQLYKPNDIATTEMFKKGFKNTIPHIAELQASLILETNPEHSTIGLIDFLKQELEKAVPVIDEN